MFMLFSPPFPFPTHIQNTCTSYHPPADAHQFNTEWESKTMPLNTMLGPGHHHTHQPRSIMPGPSCQHSVPDRSSKRQRPSSLSTEEEAAFSAVHPSSSVPPHRHHHRHYHRTASPSAEYSKKKTRVQFREDRV